MVERTRLWLFILATRAGVGLPSGVEGDGSSASELLRGLFGSPLGCSDVVGWRRAVACSEEALQEACAKECSSWVQLQREVAKQLEQAPRLPLRGGRRRMPPLALGTSGLQGSVAKEAVEFALRSGYRAVDTAVVYGNHESVGEGLRASAVPREEVFLVSKVPANMHGFEGSAAAVELMLRELGTPYVDLCLIHFPGTRWPWVPQAAPQVDAAVVVERAGTWRGLEKAHRAGLCRDIGVSNYQPKHLEELLDYAEIPPAVNQVEFHPYLVDMDTVRFCRKHGILLQVFGSISPKGLLEDPELAAVAAGLGRSPSQVLLRWALQHGVMVLPKSSQRERILENARLWDFALTPGQLSRLSALHRGRRTYLSSEDVPAMSLPRRRPWSRWRTGLNHSSVRPA